MDNLDIPDFLKISREDRRKAWVGYKHKHTEDWKERETRLRAAIAKDQQAKKMAALARLKELHIGEHYDRKLKMWIRNEK